ncbi:MAG: DEAD/DEAH box helicase, partial [Polyangiaceae bacterium]|nr:DEAD/DEAH box helicase [Polyangiaceae bacterium]
MAQAPWIRPVGVDALVQSWTENEKLRPCFELDRHLDGRGAVLVPFSRTMRPEIRTALQQRGVRALYSHQARAFELGQEAKSFVVATPTASGKSLCFHLPVLERLARDPDARAIYIYPTKALARDQEASVRELMHAAGMQMPVVVYDGDTPGDARRAARERGRIIVTNPDMLHSGILPQHPSWARTFQNLATVVADEMHVYKGVFGSNVANVFQRVDRVARFHGSTPTWIGATATIGNPVEHFSALTNQRDVELINNNGAPQASRRLFLYNPPVVNAELGIRASYLKQSVMLTEELVLHDVSTIVFAQSRNNVEVMLKYLREKLAPNVPASAIMGYRGGYLPNERRAIEERLRSGDIKCVVATNALELGIDIGDLDAVVCAGYPGSIAAMWQRFGRAGRRGKTSIALLVTSSAPLDQYFASDASNLLNAPIEEARIDPNNPEIRIQHLKCAAFELPFREGETFGTLGEETGPALDFLASRKVLHASRGMYHWSADAYPANNVSLRSMGWDNVVIIAVERDKDIAEMDYRSAHTMLHEQAIYQHDGECFQVEKFDHENHKAFVRKVKPDYFTDAMTHSVVSILEEANIDSSGPFKCAHGDVSVVEKVVGYKKIKFYTHENSGYGEVHLPELELMTTAFWFEPSDALLERAKLTKSMAVDALRGVGVALETVATVRFMSDPRDIGSTLSQPKSPGEEYTPTLFLYEHT